MCRLTWVAPGHGALPVLPILPILPILPLLPLLLPPQVTVVHGGLVKQTTLRPHTDALAANRNANGRCASLPPPLFPSPSSCARPAPASTSSRICASHYTRPRPHVRETVCVDQLNIHIAITLPRHRNPCPSHGRPRYPALVGWRLPLPSTSIHAHSPCPPDPPHSQHSPHSPF